MVLICPAAQLSWCPFALILYGDGAHYSCCTIKSERKCQQPSPRSGVGNRQSTMGDIDSVLFLACHVYTGRL